MCAGGLPGAGGCKQGGLLISVAWCGPQTSISTPFGTAATMLGRWGNQTETGSPKPREQSLPCCLIAWNLHAHLYH